MLSSLSFIQTTETASTLDTLHSGATLSQLVLHEGAWKPQAAPEYHGCARLENNWLPSSKVEGMPAPWCVRCRQARCIWLLTNHTDQPTWLGNFKSSPSPDEVSIGPRVVSYADDSWGWGRGMWAAASVRDALADTLGREFKHRLAGIQTSSGPLLYLVFLG